MTEPLATLVRPGDIVQIAKEDYLYGNEAVTVCVIGIDADLDKIPGLEWVRILTVHPGQPDAEPRALIVRVTALRQATREAGTRRSVLRQPA